MRSAASLYLPLTEVKLGLSALWLGVHRLGNVRPGVSTVLHVGTVRDLVVYRRSETGLELLENTLRFA